MLEINDSKAKNWVLGVTSLASFMMALDAMVITTAFATIRAEFGASVETLQWTVNAFNLTFAVLLLSGAALGDRFGRRKMFGAGIALFVASSAACALAPGAGWLIASRAVQGAGAALVMPLAMAILSGAFAKEERARALGIFSGVTGCALIVGPAVGGFLTATLGWRFIFWINVPIGIILIVLVAARLSESFGPQAKLDIAGLSLVAASALALVWGLIRGNQMGWSSIEVIGALALGVVFALGFVGWERRASTPMIPMRLFASRPFAAGVASSVLFYAAMYGVLFLLPQFLQVTLGFGPFGAGLRLLPWTSTLFLTAPIAGSVVQKFGERRLVATGLLMQAAGLGWIAFNVTAGAGYAAMVVPLIVAGVGVSMAMPAAQNAILSSVAVTEMGKASGVFNMGRFLGGMFGIALMVAVFSTRGAVDTPLHFSAGFAAAIMVAATLSLLAAIAGSFLPARRVVAQLKPQQA
ncbi:MAG TPA: DHA2 family efflux MFS transporter permease subunit [Bradyrhizobium sp.]|uniref:DHA2 family efflux MFS transporter permease subunit n=1 Tax=Bradyrhizobium sp. TaxID=376 RepID=UPI002B607D3B|nr:DHA2 family efflux MFS transporter permease subunit [Bradyrhizobium sp.]HLZ02123.1 DHA2 family efflux MFS transporter permease subunit [Bradyrhizobium sp.]